MIFHLNFDLWENATLEMSKLSKNTKVRAAQMVNMALLGALENDHNKFHVKSEWQL